jgi:hypothetical protein
MLSFPGFLLGTLDGLVVRTLLTWAESDPLSWNADRIYDQLKCPRELVRFYDAEGAGDHCEAKNRPLFHQRAFDWLDETLEVSQKR